MIVRYPCPSPNCDWSYSHVATPLTANVPTDILLWTPLSWLTMSASVGDEPSAAQEIDAHLSTHSHREWLAVMRHACIRAQDAEDQLDRTLSALHAAKSFTDAVDALTTRRMPTRAEWEAARTGLLALAGPDGGGADV